MQVNEGAGSNSAQQHLDLSMTRRLLLSLNQEATAIPPVIPTIEDFERLHSEIQAE